METDNVSRESLIVAETGQARMPKLVGISSSALASGSFAGISYRPLESDPNLHPEAFRDSFRKLYVCEYVAIDIKNHITGMYAGFCLAHGIPFVTVGVEGLYGSYCDFDNVEDWAKFVDTLQEQEWTLVADTPK